MFSRFSKMCTNSVGKPKEEEYENVPTCSQCLCLIPGLRSPWMSGMLGLKSSMYPLISFATSATPANNNKGEGMFLYSAVSSPLDRSKRFTLHPLGRPVHSDTNSTSFVTQQYCEKTIHLYFTIVYSQVLIHIAEWSLRRHG